jgi:hypothetical protein
MNFLVHDFNRAYKQTVEQVMWQLTEHFEEDQIVRVVQRQNPWLEEFCFKKGEELVVLVEVSVEEVKPLLYTVVARYNRENINTCRREE